MRECFNCGGKLQPVFDGAMAAESEAYDQFSEALPLYLDGGYGMFFDWPLSVEQEATLDRGTHMMKVLLCHDCGHKLCEALPAVGRLLEDGHMAENAKRSGYERCWDDPAPAR